jgi:hypothetical protein
MYLSPDFTTVPEKVWLSEAAPAAEELPAALLSFELGACD